MGGGGGGGGLSNQLFCVCKWAVFFPAFTESTQLVARSAFDISLPEI